MSASGSRTRASRYARASHDGACALRRARRTPCAGSVAARSKYAAGYTWPKEPDVWHSAPLRRKYLEMWRHVATRYKDQPGIAGYEIMSEPRTKVVSQHDVARFYAEACAVVRSVDPRAL